MNFGFKMMNFALNDEFSSDEFSESALQAGSSSVVTGAAWLAPDSHPAARYDTLVEGRPIQSHRDRAASRSTAEAVLRAEFAWVFRGVDTSAEDSALLAVDERASDWLLSTVGRAKSWIHMRELAGDRVGPSLVEKFVSFQSEHGERLTHAVLSEHAGVILREVSFTVLIYQ